MLPVLELIDLATGKTVVSSTSNSGNGEFLVCLPTGKSYALNVSKDGYLFYSENFQLKDSKSSGACFEGCWNETHQKLDRVWY
ncbi:MAG: hypothetical protein IPG90_14970 [Bacteroidetes bacterium]|nr:hypothetical protein [Bacteroidota bacterium]